MRRTLTVVGTALGALLATTPALAEGQDFGDRGQMILSADRLVPLVSYSRISQDLPDGNTTYTNSAGSLSLLWGSSGLNSPNTSGVATPENFFTVPRVGFDYVIAHDVTLGGDLMVLLPLGGSSSTQTNGNGTTSTDSPSTLGFGIAPRAGYILRTSNLVSFWLRGGFSFYTETNKSTTLTGASTISISANTNQFALDLDPQLVLTPIPHVGFTAGLGVDIPLVGQNSIEVTNAAGVSRSASASSSVLFIGATLGLFVYF